MKKNKIVLFVLTLFTGITLYAQDKKIDVDLDINKGNEVGGSLWYTQPWVWIIAGAIFILLLVAILKSGKRSS